MTNDTGNKMPVEPVLEVTLAAPELEHKVVAPQNPVPPQTVRECLERILRSGAFRQSKRYAAVLRYVVERGVEDPDSHLKEREIGMEVFGRPPDYDTAADHVVRSAASEVRKRLAQYYQDEGAHDPIRIDLQRGSYVPQFRWVHESETHPAQALPALATDEASRRFKETPLVWRVGILLLIIVVCGLGVERFFHHADAVDRFWNPLLRSNAPILLSVGTLGGAHQEGLPPATDNGMTLSDFHRFDYVTIHVGDAETLATVTGFFGSRRKPYQIATQSQTTYADLQRNPVVLVGLMNNDWTERLVVNLRFKVARLSPNVLSIRDGENPGNVAWSIDYSKPYLDLTRDYAIIARLPDPKTGQMVVMIAGLSVFGTNAAGQFVTDPEQIAAIDAIAPRGWEHKSVELVLSTDVIRGVSGRAKILASRFW